MRILRTTRTKRAPAPPPPVTRQISPILKNLNARFEAFDTSARHLQLRWPEIVGDALAKLCQPVKLIKAQVKPTAKSSKKPDGVLELRCESVYAALLSHQSPQIIDRVNLFLGKGTIAKVRFVQLGLNSVSAEKPKTSRRPLDAGEELKLHEMLQDVEDDALKQSLLRLGRAVVRTRGF